MLKNFLRWLALRHGRCRFLYVKLCKPRGDEYAKFLKRHGRLHAIGERCSISSSANITDPEYVRLGNNVQLSSCSLICHDGAIAMLGKAYPVKLDSVGKIDIKDNVFVGLQAIVLPGATIGPNAIVAAGSVVTRDVAEGDIVAGSPAKPIGKVSDLVKKLAASTKQLPWCELIEQRESGYDEALEPRLRELRVAWFFPKEEPARNGCLTQNEAVASF